MRIFLAACLFVVFGFMIGFLYGETKTSNELGDHAISWNVYHGELRTVDAVYNVQINEDDRGYGFRRLVHLELAGEPGYVGITGHDYDGDGKWDRVFYCGNHERIGQDPRGGEFGCNSVLRTRNGWKFEPCPVDKDVIQPFSNAAISFAITKLDDAMNCAHDKSHLIEQWEWSSVQKRLVRLCNN